MAFQFLGLWEFPWAFSVLENPRLVNSLSARGYLLNAQKLRVLFNLHFLRVLCLVARKLEQLMPFVRPSNKAIRIRLTALLDRG